MDVVGGHGVEVADAASDEALEDEDVALGLQVSVAAHVGIGYLISFLDADIYRCSIDLRADGESAEWVVGGDFLVEAPVVEGAKHFHYAIDVVFASLYRISAFGYEVVESGIFGYRMSLAVLVCADKFVFVAEEISEII